MIDVVYGCGESNTEDTEATQRQHRGNTEATQRQHRGNTEEGQVLKD